MRSGGRDPSAHPPPQGAVRTPPQRRPDPRWRPRPSAPLAGPVWQRQGSDFKALVSGREWACARPAFPTAPSRAPSPRSSLRRTHVTPEPRRLGLPPPPLQSPRRGCAASCPRRAPSAAASPAATWPAPPAGGPRPRSTARPAAERGSEAGGPARPRSRARRGPAPSPARLPAPLCAPPPRPARPQHGDGGEGVRRPGRALPGHRQRHEGNRGAAGPGTREGGCGCVSPSGTRGGG